MRLFNKNKSALFNVNSVKAPPTRFPYFFQANLEQGSDEWKYWRKGVIGASDAPIIMGENRWQSAKFLLEEKLGIHPEFAGNAATREGNRLEEEARRLLAKKFKIDLAPSVIQDGELPFLAASLDGIDRKHSQVFEIKCGAKAYELVSSKGEIPGYYYGQLQHILMITQLDKIVYAAYRPFTRLITIEIERNELYISKLRASEIKFAESLRNRGHKLQSDFVGERMIRI